MASVEYIVALEQQMELVPLRRGWWVAFGAPRQPAKPAPALEPVSPDIPAPAAADAPEAGGRQAASGERPALGRPRQRAGTVPPSEPRRRDRREPQPPSPRPMPDPAPQPVPDPPSTPDLPVIPRSGRGGRR